MSEPAPADRTVFVSAEIDRERDGQIRVDLRASFRRAALPPKGFWQSSRDLACLEGEVVLQTLGASITDHTSNRSIPVAQETVRKTALAGGEGAKADVKLAGAGFSLNSENKRETGYDHKTAWTGSHDLLTFSLLDKDRGRWNCHLPPAGLSYIERTEDLYVTAKPFSEDSAEPSAKEYHVHARTKRFQIIDNNDKPIPRMTMWAILAKLIGRREFDPQLLKYDLIIPIPPR